MLAALSPERFINRWREILSLNDAIAIHAKRWLALLDGSAVGFVSAGPPRDLDPPANGELYAIHVDSPTIATASAGRSSIALSVISRLLTRRPPT